MKHDWFPQSGGKLLGALWTAQPMKVALLDPAFVPDRDTQLLWADVSADEVAAGAPYVAGGAALAGKAVVYDAANDRTNYVADDTVWGPALTVDAGFAVIYDSASGSLWSLVDFEGTKSIVNGTLTIDWAAIGLLYAATI